MKAKNSLTFKNPKVLKKKAIKKCSGDMVDNYISTKFCLIFLNDFCENVFYDTRSDTRV